MESLLVLVMLACEKWVNLSMPFWALEVTLDSHAEKAQIFCQSLSTSASLFWWQTAKVT